MDYLDLVRDVELIINVSNDRCYSPVVTQKKCSLKEVLTQSR